MRRTRILFLVLAGLAAVLVGCGDDGGGSAEAYCDLIEELEAEDAEPNEENFERLLEVTPDEIKDDAQVLIDAFNSEDQEAAFEDEEALEASQNLSEFEEENCGDGGEDGGDSGSEDTVVEESVPADE